MPANRVADCRMAGEHDEEEVFQLSEGLGVDLTEAGMGGGLIGGRKRGERTGQIKEKCVEPDAEDLMISGRFFCSVRQILGYMRS